MAEKQAKTKNPKHRPTTYTQRKADIICERIALGESLIRICATTPELPTKMTVLRWLQHPDREDFRSQYTRARQDQADTFIDQCTDIADEVDRDTIIKVNKDGSESKQPDHEWIGRSRLRVETRLKLSEKLYPKKYKPVEGREHTGADGGPIMIDITRGGVEV